jgi:hypothetical protein
VAVLGKAIGGHFCAEQTCGAAECGGDAWLGARIENGGRHVVAQSLLQFDLSPHPGPSTTDGGSLPPSPLVDREPMPQIDGDQ